MGGVGEMGKNVKILISCHKASDSLNTEVFQPIQLGCANTDQRLPGMLYDNTGENISAKNPMYCELTAQYWAWKNLDADYYGFCHYRRYFSFSDTHYPEDAFGNVLEKYLDASVIKKYNITDVAVHELTSQYDIITTVRKDVSLIPNYAKSIRQQYAQATLLHPEDMDLLQRIIDEEFPDYSEAAHAHLDGKMTSFCNMYILRKDIFFDYCQWMFAVLDRFCQMRDMSRYSTEALRTPGHLSERLFGIYYLYITRKNPSLKTKELQCVLFEKTQPQEPLKPAFMENSVPVVFAANNNFVPMFAACLQSVIEHTSSDHNYDIVLLQSDVTEDNQATLLKMVSGYPNISLRFFDAGRLLTNYQLKANAHISVETYYRFLIQDVLPDYEKILYLDCDLIANADVAELYETDMTGYMVAAVHDADFLGQINGANMGTKLYVQEKFHMKNPYDYFQAGVLLFNETEMRKAYTLDEWLTFASKPYQYNDQDVLNLYCEGHVKFLDMAWNLITDCDHTRIKNVIVYAPDAIQREYRAAHANPKLIHYAGFMKPWHRPTEDYAQYFWEALRKTPYYEELLYRMADGICYWQIYENNKKLPGIASFGSGKMKDRLKNLCRGIVGIFFPKGSVGRERIKRFFRVKWQ